MIRYRYIGYLTIALLLSAGANADESIVGYIKTVSPEAFLTVNNRTELAKIGSPVYTGTTIRTSPEGTLGLALKDDTLLSFGPDTEFQLSEFVYQPSENRLQLTMSIMKGTLQYISGVISKLKPEAIKLKTPTSIIGVRGTRFVVKVDD